MNAAKSEERHGDVKVKSKSEQKVTAKAKASSVGMTPEQMRQKMSQLNHSVQAAYRDVANMKNSQGQYDMYKESLKARLASLGTAFTDLSAKV